MALSAFDDKTHKPEADELAQVLGRSGRLWNELTAGLSAQYDPLGQEWRFSGQNWGWSLRLKHKKRAIVYLTPCKRHFLAGFALGEKAAKAAHAAGLPPQVLECIDNATKYAEGRAVRLEVRTRKDLAAVQQVVALKMAN